MIDLSKLDSISMEEPLPDGGFVHMRDMPVAGPEERQSGDPREEKAIDGIDSNEGHKGKGKASISAITVPPRPIEVGSKRERSPEDELELLLRVAPSGSRLVADFLSGSGINYTASPDIPRPVNRRRVEVAQETGT